VTSGRLVRELLVRSSCMIGISQICGGKDDRKLLSRMKTDSELKDPISEGSEVRALFEQSLFT